MTTRPEALRLAESLMDYYKCSDQDIDEAAAELRRLHVENKLLAGAADILRVAWRDGVHNLMKDKDQLQAHRDALLEAYRKMKNVAAGYSNLCDGSAFTRKLKREFEAADAIARAAIKAVEEGK